MLVATSASVAAFAGKVRSGTVVVAAATIGFLPLHVVWALGIPLFADEALFRAPTFAEAVIEQNRTAAAGKKPDLQALVSKGQSWMVEKEPRAE